MDDKIKVEPLPYNARRRTFGLLVLIFVIAIPFLYLYATGYRFDFERPTNLVSTGGIYVAVDHSDMDVFIDDELTKGSARTFRKAYYAQNLDVGTHRVHVQKDDYHTWVKELPVSKHLVTVTQAFNLPLAPQARIITPWITATGSPHIATSSILLASTTNSIVASSTYPTTSLATSTEFIALHALFATTTATSTETIPERVIGQVEDLISIPGEATTTIEMEVATTTKETKEVRMFEAGDDLFVKWVGDQEDMPYYYCAEQFEPYSTSTEDISFPLDDSQEAAVSGITNETEEALIHPVQVVTDPGCEPIIQIHTQFQEVRGFDFLPGSTDLVVLLLEKGIYVIEIDDRAWQNVQPLILGEDLDMRIENGQIYVYDGKIIYQMVLEYDE